MLRPSRLYASLFTILTLYFLGTMSSLAETQVLIDTQRNLRIESWKIDHADLDLDTDQAWSIRKYVLHGGRQEGVDVIQVDNGHLSFLVVPTRGMNLWEGRAGDVRLGWDSPVEQVVHPQFVNLTDRGGLGWLEGFGEWMCRCGLASMGLPGEDRVVSNTGEIIAVNLTLHGKISNIPAHYVEVRVEGQRLIVKGIVDETMLFGPRLRLITEYSTEIGSPSLTIRDEIQNRAATPQEMEILYHCNFGSPILEEGAQVVVPIRQVAPRDARAAEGGMQGWNEYRGPEAGYVEQAYFIQPAANAAGRTEALLKNADGSRGASVHFSVQELPYLSLWKNTAARENGYVTGIEPGTNFPNLRTIEREQGRLRTLQGGESYHSTVTIDAHTTAEGVTAAEGRIEAIQSGVEPVVLLEPEE